MAINILEARLVLMRLSKILNKKKNYEWIDEFGKVIHVAETDPQCAYAVFTMFLCVCSQVELFDACL